MWKCNRLCHPLSRTAGRSASESAELGVRFDKAFQDPPVLSRADPVTTLPCLSRQPTRILRFAMKIDCFSKKIYENQ